MKGSGVEVQVDVFSMLRLLALISSLEGLFFRHTVGPSLATRS